MAKNEEEVNDAVVAEQDLKKAPAEPRRANADRKAAQDAATEEVVPSSEEVVDLQKQLEEEEKARAEYSRQLAEEEEKRVEEARKEAEAVAYVAYPSSTDEVVYRGHRHWTDEFGVRHRVPAPDAKEGLVKSQAEEK